MRDMASAYTAYGKAGADWAKEQTPAPQLPGPLTWETGGGVNAGMPWLVGPRDRSGGRVRDLLAGARRGPPLAEGRTFPVPRLPRPTIDGVPNPAYGEMYGLEWDGEKWVKANTNADLERQLKELEVEKRRKEVNSSDQGDLLRAWLSKRLGSIE